MPSPGHLDAPSQPHSRAASPTRSISKSTNSLERRRSGMSRLKLKLGMSAENLAVPVPGPAGAAQSSSDTRPHRHIRSRLQALFSPQSPHRSGWVSETPPVLPVPELSNFDLAHDVLGPMHGVGPKPAANDREFIKMKVITWNHGYTIPKGDLGVLLGHVPTYQPPTEDLKGKLPVFTDEDIHPYHIVVVAGQECPSQSKMPLGLGAGIKFEKKEWDKKLEKRRSKNSAKSNPDGDREMDPTHLEPPTTPLPAEKYNAAMSSAPSTPGMVYQHPPGPSTHSFKSLVHDVNAKHHHHGWSEILVDWFCNGMGSVLGAKPIVPPEVVQPPETPAPVSSDSPPPATPATAPNTDLTKDLQPPRSPTPESARDGVNAPWRVSPEPGLVIKPDELTEAPPRGPYVLHSKERLMAMTLYIFIHRDVEPLVTGTSKSVVTAGLMGGRVGNKGGVGISLKVADTSFLFVNAHLAAHESRTADRIANMAKIKADLELDNFLAPDDPRAMKEDITDQFDHTFIFGDLNFRLNVTRLHAEWLISREDYATALTFDQLKLAMKDPPFLGLEEAPINFAPTFKYDVLKTIRKRHKVRDALREKASRRLRPRRGSKPDPGEVDGEESSCSESSSSSSSDEEEDDSHSIVSSAHRSFRSMKLDEGIEEDEEDEDTELLSSAARNAVANATMYTLDVQAAAHRAKEKFLSLVNRPVSPSPALLVRPPSTPARTPSPSVAPEMTRKPTSEPSSPRLPPTPLPSSSVPKSAHSALELPRKSQDSNRPPLKRALSTKSHSTSKGDLDDKNLSGISDRDRGVYDTSSKQRVPSWCDRILFKSNVLPKPEPLTEVEPEKQPGSRLANFLLFKRPRRDAPPTSGSPSESSPETSKPSPTSHGPLSPGLEKPPMPPSPSASSHGDSPSRSPLARLSLPALLPQHHRPDRTTSLTVVPSVASEPVDSSSMPTSPHRSFTTPAISSFAASEQTATRSPSRNSVTVVDLSEASSEPKSPTVTDHSTVNHNPFKWLLSSLSFARDSPPTATPAEELAPAPAHARGDVVCVSYHTLDDRQMRQLEARSDHRPVMGEYLVYI